jgi:hypothetical protein
MVSALCGGQGFKAGRDGSFNCAHYGLLVGLNVLFFCKDDTRFML